MQLFHGSSVIVKTPRIIPGKKGRDFGVGFYVTTDQKQAKQWAYRKRDIERVNAGYISVYEFDYEKALKEMRIQFFEAANDSWLKFVSLNRKRVSTVTKYDISIGPVADDNLMSVIRLYETGVYSFDETIVRLKTETLTDQWVFHNQEALNRLSFVSFETVL